MSKSRFTCLLLCWTTVISTPALADATLDELKAKLERAEKENIILKTEKIERENISMKLQKMEAENAALRNEAKIDKTPTASIPTKRLVATSSNNHEIKKIIQMEPTESKFPAPREQAIARKEINHALDNIPKDDSRREMTAAYKTSKDEATIIVKKWQGVYAGINAGYGYNDANTIISEGFGVSTGNNGSSYTDSYGTVTNTSSPNAGNNYFSGTNYFTVNGPLAGAQVGYNYQFNNNIILGLEADMNYADFVNGGKGRSYINAGSNSSSNNSSFFSGGGYENDRISIDWIGTLRARLGYSIGQFMPYFTGGFAYGGLSNISANGFYSGFLSSYNYSSQYYNNSNYDNNNYNSAGGGSKTTIGTGWVLGAGAEYMIADGWSLKGEYLYTSIGSLFTSGASSGSSVYGSGYSYGYSGSYPYSYANNSTFNNQSVIVGNSYIPSIGVHQARFGLNYHTDWLKGLPTSLR